VESDFLKTDIGRSLEWGLWEDLIKSNVVYYSFPLANYSTAVVATNDTGSAGSATAGFYARTGTTSGSDALAEAEIRENVPEREPKWTWDRRKIMKVTTGIQDASLMEGGFAHGRIGWNEDFTYQHVGFYVLNDEIHMSVADGTTHNHSLATTFTAGEVHTFMVELKPGDRAIFWIDGAKQGELASNLPSGLMSAPVKLFSVYITNDEAVDKRLEFAQQFQFLQLED